MKQWLITACLGLGLITVSAHANEQEMQNILNSAKAYQTAEKNINAFREAAFNKDLKRQRELLNKIKAQLRAQEKVANKLKSDFNNNEKKLADKEEQLRLATGNLGEMFGVVRQVSEDFKNILNDSLTLLELPKRKADLDKLAEAKALPKLSELEDLWYSLQQEMILNGQIKIFSAPVVDAQGKTQAQKVTRIGVFNAILDGEYLRFSPKLQRLERINSQPPVAKWVSEYQTSSEPVSILAIDPSRGALLNLTLESPSLLERVEQGAEVGYIIIALGVLGLLIALWRTLVLVLVKSKLDKQIKQLDKPENNNPLGRLLQAYGEIKQTKDTDILEAKLDEAILKELPLLERGQNLIKLFAGIAPLLGLLGTVTGMIATFQSITNFGTGDPKLMASGISQALITTVLGLIAAIPLLLAHSFVASKSKRLTQILDEQSAGLIAEHMENKDA